MPGRLTGHLWTFKTILAGGCMGHLLKGGLKRQGSAAAPPLLSIADLLAASQPSAASGFQCAGSCSMQWHRVSLLVWPRSMRLESDIRDNLAQQTVRLHDMLVRASGGQPPATALVGLDALHCTGMADIFLQAWRGKPGFPRSHHALQGVQPDSNTIIALRGVAADASKQYGGWLADELAGRFDGAPPDPCDGFDALLDEHGAAVGMQDADMHAAARVATQSIKAESQSPSVTAGLAPCDIPAAGIGHRSVPAGWGVEPANAPAPDHAGLALCVCRMKPCSPFPGLQTTLLPPPSSRGASAWTWYWSWQLTRSLLASRCQAALSLQRHCCWLQHPVRLQRGNLIMLQCLGKP